METCHLSHLHGTFQMTEASCSHCDFKSRNMCLILFMKALNMDSIQVDIIVCVLHFKLAVFSIRKFRT